MLGSTGPPASSLRALQRVEALSQTFGCFPLATGSSRRIRRFRPTARPLRRGTRTLSFGDREIRTKNVETPIEVKTGDVITSFAGEAIKDPKLSATLEHADGLVLVVPEYNHGYPGMLKHVLDSNLKEYIHKAVGICGVSAGGFGATRVIENLLPVMRELGLVTIFWDGNFSGAQKLFDENGTIHDEAVHVKRMDKFLGELIWMSKVLRHGRENISL